MTTNELIGVALAVGVGSLLVEVAKVGARLALGTNGRARNFVIGGADYVEWLKGLARVAEKTGLPGPAKAAAVIEQVDAWLDAEGVHGDARAVTIERVRADLDGIVDLIFPKVDQPAA